MAKLTDKQKQFLQKHGMWNAEKSKSKLGILEEGNFKDFFRRKEAVEADLALLPDGDSKTGLTKRLLEAEEKAKAKKFKVAYKDLEQVKKDARKAADIYVSSVTPGTLDQEIKEWKIAGELLRSFVDQAVDGKKAVKDALAKYGNPAPFASFAVAEKFLEDMDTAELSLHSQMDDVSEACEQVDNLLTQNDPVTKLREFSHKLSVLRKSNVDTQELDLRVESAHVLFIVGGKTLSVGEIGSDIEQITGSIDTTIEGGRPEAQRLAKKIYWEEESGKVEAEMLKVLKGGVLERNRIMALWDIATDRVGKGGAGDYVAGVTLLDDVKSALSTATPDDFGSKGGVAKTGAELTKARELQAAQAILATKTKAAEEALTRIRKEFKPTLPDALNVQALKLDGLIAPSTETDPAEVKKLADSVADETAKLDELAVAPRTEKAAWKQDLADIELQLGILKKHPLQGEATTVKPLIDKITEDLEKAKLDGTAMKWTDASAAVKLLIPRCEAATKTADNLACYSTILTEREQRVGTLPTGVIADEVARKAVEAAKKLLADAKLEKTAGKLPAAIDLLNKIPAAVDNAALQVDRSTTYTNILPTWEGYETELNAYTGDAKEAIKEGVKLFNEQFAAAKIDQTKDYQKSIDIMIQIRGLYNSLTAIAKQIKDYADALQAFETRFTEVKDHKGRIAIEEFFARMENDRTFADVRKKAGDGHVGTKILNETQPLHAAQIELAVKAENYKAKHKKAGEDVDALEKEKNGGKAAAELAEAKTRMAAGETAATGKDWPGALKAIEQAEASIAAARKLMADDKELAGKKDTGKLDAIDKDFDAAYAVYTDMRQFVAGKDSGNVFATKLAAADAPALRCREAAGTSVKDYVEARKELDAAITICEETLQLVSKKASYDTALPGLKTAHTTTLPGLNTDDCILSKIDEVGEFVKQAELLAKAPAFNFDGAQGQIGNGLMKVREAERDAEAYAAMKPQVKEITDTLAYLKESVRAAGLASEIQRLETAGTSINNDVTAGKMLDAAKTAAAAAKLCPGFKVVGQHYERAKLLIRDAPIVIADIEGLGKEACAQQLAQAKRWADALQKFFDDHIYSKCDDMYTQLWWAVDAGKKVLKAAEDYELVRGAADTKLQTTPNRNAATEERYLAIKARYDAAVNLATTQRNYARAKDMVSTIPKECDDLAGDTKKFQNYEASLKKAKEKLEEAKTAKHSSIQPLLAQLNARYETAGKIAKSGDYSGAKKLLDEVFTGASDAIKAGDEAADYVKAAEDLKNPGTDIHEAIEKAEKIYKELMGKPEALYVVATLGGINKKIQTAKDNASSDPDGARYGLIEVVDACAKARIDMGHYTQMEAEMTSLEKEIKTLITKVTKTQFLKVKAEKMQEDIEAARRLARGTGQYVASTKILAAVAADLITLHRDYRAHSRYRKSRRAVDLEVEKMEKHANRYAIVDAIASCRKNLSNAAKAAPHDNKAAMALLEKAAEMAADALLSAKMHSEAEPTVAELKKILGGKDGSKRLDAIVATLDPKSKRKVLDVAFEARFDCKLRRVKSAQHEKDAAEWLKNNPGATDLQKQQVEDYLVDADKEKKAPDVQRFYNLMSALPETHTKDNDSIQVFLQSSGQDQEGSDYTGSTVRKLAMREGDVPRSFSYGVAAKHEIGEVEDGCEVEEGDPISAFDWNTIHEVGHAVDDKLGFMASRGNSLAGWTVYGGNVRPIAVAVAKKYDFDVAYVASYMANASAIAIPEPKSGVTAEEWERRRVACMKWVDGARAGNNPWSSASTAAALAIDGVVYHESYSDGRWASYNLAARKQGVTGYQFRAPGEWFSELYAAYHTQKLKPSHPAYTWLQSL